MKKRRKLAPRPKPPVKSNSNGGRKFDFLYLLERVTGKTARSKVFGELEVKFGVTNKSVKDRKEEINLDMPGEVVLVTWVYIPQKAGKYERQLLKKWERKLNPKNAGPSAGRTEWRRVTWLEYVFILWDYSKIKNRKLFRLAKILIILTILILYYVNATT